MGYKQNNPLPRMKSALKMEKEMKKGGMHRDSAMYMNHGMHRDSSMYMKDGMHRESVKQEKKDLMEYNPVDDRAGSPAMAAKPDYIDIDGDGNKTESMKDAAKDKKGSPAKKYDRVVLGGNKGDKSKTKPGEEDYEKGSPAKMSKKRAERKVAKGKGKIEEKVGGDDPDARYVSNRRQKRADKKRNDGTLKGLMKSYKIKDNAPKVK